MADVSRQRGPKDWPRWTAVFVLAGVNAGCIGSEPVNVGFGGQGGAITGVGGSGASSTMETAGTTAHTGAGGTGGGGGAEGGSSGAGGQAPEDLSIGFEGNSATEQYGGSGGDAYKDPCPAGQALIGYHGALINGYHGEIQGQCGKLAPAAQGTGSVTVTPGAELPMRGSLGENDWTRDCPKGHVIVGFQGRSGDFVDRLAFRCAPLAVQGSPGAYTIVMGSVTTTQPVGGKGGDAFPITDCPTGQIARASRLRAGAVIDAFGLVCAKPIVKE
jgi:hypothetical protein